MRILIPTFVRLLSRPDDGDGAPAPGSGAAGVADAGRAFLAGLPAEAQNVALADPDEELDGADADDIDVAPEGTAQPALARDEDGATWNAAAGRWVLDGKFVAGDAPENAPPKPARAAPGAAVTDLPAKTDADAPETERKATVITLPGHAERGEEDLELEVDDPAIVERLTRLRNDGMRRKQFDERMQTVRAAQAEIDETNAEFDMDPVGFTLGRMTSERQLELARALLVEHLEALAPDIDRYIENPIDREKDRNKQLTSRHDNAGKVAEQKRLNAAARQIMNAVEQLIPDGVDQQDANDFMAEARADLMRAAQAGASITPDNVKQLLARRLQRYAFDAAAAVPAGKPATPAAAPAPTARPVSDRARELASRPTAAEVKAKQDQIRRTQVRRAAATRVAPATAGAGPVQVPVLRPEETTSIEAASRAMRKKLANGGGWPPTA